MIAQVLARALKKKKPAVIKENGSPRFVVLDWSTYNIWQEMKEDFEDTARLIEALADPKNQKRTSLSEVRKRLHLP
jgi:PHD/YefM family antitoxin component YafN of YafNO toxin-antitoxin module